MNICLSRKKYEVAVEVGLQKILVPLGFHRRRDNSYDLTTTDGCKRTCFATFTRDRSIDQGSMGVGCSIALPKITKFMRQCKVFSKDASVGRFATSLFNLSKKIEHSGWLIDAGTDVDILGVEVADAIQSYALPFFEKYGTYDVAISVFQSDSSVDRFMPPRRFDTLSAIYWLQGNRKAATDLVEEQINKFGPREVIEKARAIDYLSFLKGLQ